MYDVVKFRVGIPGKKVTALTLAAVAPAVGADVYLLPYSTQKDRSFTAGKVKEADKISGNYSYYTLDMRLKDKMVSCPLMTVDGQVFGVLDIDSPSLNRFTEQDADGLTAFVAALTRSVDFAHGLLK